MTSIKRKAHWEKIYETQKETEASWYQAVPKISLDYIQLLQLPLEANIIDIGGGDSHLANALLDLGYVNIYVLDISERAIERAKKKLGEKAGKVNWIVSDILEFNADIQFDVWHDRAAFHFLTSEKHIDQYLSIAKKSIKQDGYLILGTFSENGPDTCSGLEISKYAATSLQQVFSEDFEKIRCTEVSHITPFQTIQSFTFCSFTRKYVE
jgi:2-polyprenyl-3-methyl-5-hydroxy-6-metoxy-1,4-benzoquinol methylase